MKTCPDCGGMWHRHGRHYAPDGTEVLRFKCKDCSKTITVRNGQISNGTGPRVRDWRTETTTEARQ